MKKSCNAVLLVLFLALLANAQEAPPPLSKDSSLAVTADSSLVVAKESSSSVAQVSSSSSIANANEQKANKNAEIMNLFKKTKKIDPEDYQKNLRPVFYLNPLALFYGAANNMFMFSTAFEIPLDLGNSVIIQPAAWLGSSNEYIFFGEVEYEKLIRIGSGIGVRRYAYNRGQGFYLQAIASAYYISAESISYKETPDERSSYENIKSYIKVKGMVGDLIFYVGLAHKWQNISFFYEVGAGFGYDGTDTYQIGYVNKLVLSLNVGLGIPF